MQVCWEMGGRLPCLLGQVDPYHHRCLSTSWSPYLRLPLTGPLVRQYLAIFRSSATYVAMDSSFPCLLVLKSYRLTIGEGLGLKYA